MATQILATKLFIPRLRPDLVARQRLIDRLNQGWRSGHKLTLISAPAGFGKSTLLSAWIHSGVKSREYGAGEAHASAGGTSPAPYSLLPTPSFAWLSLDKNDNDPVRFLTYLLTALQRVDPDVGQTAQAMLQASQPPALEGLLTSLINDIAATPQPCIFVLDDYHTIDAQPIHAALAFLLENLPPQLHLVIATRADPPLPIARLRARGQLNELHAADLRFSPQEALTFLNEIMGLALAPGQIAALESRTEGWAAGLQLAALSLRGRDGVSAFIKAFTGSHRYVLDYLTEEVLHRQPQKVQAFLLQTAILDRLTGPLCDQVTERTDSHSLLETLETENLFITPLHEERLWYRYHQLFADLLRHRLQQERRDLVPVLHRRASEWYEDHGLIPEAVGHALAAGDRERAAELIEWTAWTVLIRGEMATLSSWLNALPDSLVRSRPRLGVCRAWALAFMGKLADAESQLAEVDVQQVPGDAAAVRAHVAALRGDLPGTIALSHLALEQLPAKHWFSRGLVALGLGIAYWRSGDLAAASRALTEAIAYGRQADQKYLTLRATATLGHVQKMQGLLRQAVKNYRLALELADEPASRPVPFASIACVGIAESLYEWNDLDGALRYALQGIRLRELGGFVAHLLLGHAILARVHQVRGDVDSALEVMHKAERLAQEYDSPRQAAVVEDLRAWLWLAQGNAAAASQWAREHKWRPVDALSSAREVEQIAVARVCIAQGESGEALKLLGPLLQAAQAAGRTGSTIKILALQAHALQARGDGDQALLALARVLSLAEPEGYVRTFVDEGEPMAQLLRRALTQGMAPEYVGRLLAAFGATADGAPGVAQPLIEPLSERELEVLRLIAAGLSNREIAQELVIAISTVKSHVNHIYGKLEVRNRTGAVARARSLDLL